MEMEKSMMENGIFQSMGYCVLREVEDRISGIDVDATSERISNLINASGLDDKTISEQIRVTPQAVNRWRNKASLATVDNLYALSGILGIAMDNFFVAREKKLEPSIVIEAKPFKSMTNNVIQAYCNEFIKLFQQKKE